MSSWTRLLEIISSMIPILLCIFSGLATLFAYLSWIRKKKSEPNFSVHFPYGRHTNSAICGQQQEVLLEIENIGGSDAENIELHIFFPEEFRFNSQDQPKHRPGVRFNSITKEDDNSRYPYYWNVCYSLARLLSDYYERIRIIIKSPEESGTHTIFVDIGSRGTATRTYSLELDIIPKNKALFDQLKKEDERAIKEFKSTKNPEELREKFRIWQSKRIDMLGKIFEGTEYTRKAPYKVLFSFEAKKQIEEDILSHPGVVYGGLLLGFVESDQYFVIESTGGGPKSHYGSSFFTPDTEYMNLKIKEAEERGLFFLGEWHSSPSDISDPSLGDIRLVEKVFSSNEHLLYFLLLIVTKKKRILNWHCFSFSRDGKHDKIDSISE